MGVVKIDFFDKQLAVNVHLTFFNHLEGMVISQFPRAGKQPNIFGKLISLQPKGFYEKKQNAYKK